MSTKHSRERPHRALATLTAKVGSARTLAAFLAFAFVLLPTGGRAQDSTLAGRWTAPPMRVDWKIGDWGPACGPRPSGGGAPGGTVVIKTQGSELVMSGAGRTYSTSECWEQFPGLTRVSHSAGSGRWNSVCQTPAGDPRQARVATTISRTGDTQIHFDETGQYQFVLEGQNCTASVRRTRTLTLLQREGEATAPLLSAPQAVPSQPPAPTTRCVTKGLPERLEVRPSRKLMRPGEAFTFRAAVVDRAGCGLNIVPTWRVVAGGEALTLLAPGKVQIAENAEETEARLQASVGDRAVSITVEVVSHERYDALLREGGFNAEGESAEAAIARIATESIGTRSSVVREEAEGRKTAFIAVIGGMALAFGLAGLFFLGRSRKQKKAALALPRPTAPPTQSISRRGGNVCPTCREEFPVGAEFCAFDGNRLVPLTSESGIGPTGGVCPLCSQGYDPGVTVCPKHNEPLVPALVHAERRPSLPSTRRICPVCGTQFPGESQFCGKCGAALVPVN